MFGNNSIVGKKFFENMGDNNLLVTSIFATLQGEGPHSGKRCVFVRLAMCNLACKMCDTYFDKGENYNNIRLLEKIIDTIASWNKQNNPKGNKIESVVDLLKGWGLVITGGEPLLQANNLGKFLGKDVVYPATFSIREPEFRSTYFDWHQIETNGILDCSAIPSNTDIVCSPKCAEKNGVATHYIKPHHTVLQKAMCMKFVVSADPTSMYHDIPEFALDWSKETGKPIYVSPMNMYLKEPQAALVAAKSNDEITIDERSEVLERISFFEPELLDQQKNQMNHEHAALLCMKYNCILSLQTHLYASLP